MSGEAMGRVSWTLFLLASSHGHGHGDVSVSSGPDTALWVAAIGVIGALLVAVIGALATYFSNRRERCRLLYSEAVRAAVAWKEMLYRVRRRQAGQEQELIKQFHDLQDNLSYYSAWVGSESEDMKESYDRFVKGVKDRTETLIVDAWAKPTRPVPGNAQQGDVHPDLSDLTDSFLTDIRDHLSLRRKQNVKKRNQAARRSNSEPPSTV
jgi:hypothetical protein